MVRPYSLEKQFQRTDTEITDLPFVKTNTSPTDRPTVPRHEERPRGSNGGDLGGSAGVEG